MLLTYLSIVSILPPFLLFLLKQKWRLYPEVFGLVLVKIAGELLGLASLFLFVGMNNLFGYHISTVLEFILILFVFQGSTHFPKLKRHHVLLFSTLFITLAVINAWLWEPLTSFNSNTKGLLTLTATVLSLAWFRNMFLYSKNYYIEKSTDFWVVVYLLIYYSGNFFVHLFFNLLMTLGFEAFSASFDIYLVLNILANLTLTWAIWLIPTRSSRS